MGLVAFAALAAGIVAATVLMGRRAHALGRVAAVALAATTVLWIAGLLVAARGWLDIDGWIDCYPHCTVWHGVGAFWFLMPPLIAIGLVGVLVWVGARRARSGEESPR